MKEFILYKFGCFMTWLFGRYSYSRLLEAQWNYFLDKADKEEKENQALDNK